MVEVVVEEDENEEEADGEGKEWDERVNLVRVFTFQNAAKDGTMVSSCSAKRLHGKKSSVMC